MERDLRVDGVVVHRPGRLVRGGADESLDVSGEDPHIVQAVVSGDHFRAT